ncbi:MAG: cupin domain-containing protein [Solirubrobacterales bacterium]
MKVINVEALPFMQTAWGIQGKPVVDLPEIGIILLALKPGETVPMHKTPVDVLFQVVEGSGTVTVGEESGVVSAGDIVVSPAQIPHRLEATQNVPFSVYVMKTPNMKKTAIKDSNG